MKKTLSVLCRIFCIIISINIILINAAFANGYSSSEIDGIINKAISRQKSINGGTIYPKNSESVGTTDSDWFIIALNRSGKSEDFQTYYSMLKNNVQNRYKTEGKLHAVKASEWHRITLSALSCGGDPLSFGTNSNGTPINLISDGVYNRGNTASLGKQGINGWIWGLIALDSKLYSIPSGAVYSRDDIIVEILRQQLNDGGFSLSSSSADPDITAMAITALSTYINSDSEYSYTLTHSNKSVKKTVRQVVNEGISALSKMQNSNGGYSSFGIENAESTAQVIIALCSVGINPASDSRFIKSGRSTLDALLSYRLQSGVFTHSFASDSNNPAAAAGQENTLATHQSLLALTAYKRFINNQRKLYDFRAEMNADTAAKISTLNEKINNFANTQAELNEIKNLYSSLPSSERCYVYNYGKVLGVSIADTSTAGINPQNTAPQDLEASAIFDTGAMAKYDKAPSVEMVKSLVQKGLMGVRLHISRSEEMLNSMFTDEDRSDVEKACAVLSTEHYYTVLRLIDKIEGCEPFEDIEAVKAKLYAQRTAIETVITEIDSINNDVLNNLYPFEEISVSDRKLIHSIMDRISVLSEYDKKKINNLEDIDRAMVKVDNEHRGILISVAAIQLLVVMAAIIMFRVTKVIRQRRIEDGYEE